MHQGQESAFQARVACMEEQYARRSGLMKRLRRVGLV
jgi:hypothetical protein